MRLLQISPLSKLRYKHHNLGTNFDIFNLSEFKIPLVIEIYIPLAF